MAGNVAEYYSGAMRLHHSFHHNLNDMLHEQQHHDKTA